MDQPNNKLIVGITGASGAILAAGNDHQTTDATTNKICGTTPKTTTRLCVPAFHNGSYKRRLAATVAAATDKLIAGCVVSAIPPDAKYINGILFTLDGKLCVGLAPIVNYVDGWPVNAIGAIIMSGGGITPPTSFDLPLDGSLIPGRPWWKRRLNT